MVGEIGIEQPYRIGYKSNGLEEELTRIPYQKK